jgi:hypothetical protein
MKRVILAAAIVLAASGVGLAQAPLRVFGSTE